ncbi:MAG: polysaccharide deacetylase family sporulation protein PdaB [Bacillaceae bacterium]|nr:polysaccharide deacetylase family sporulation protein PdaB [Bacillaceae bacterium]
MKFIWVLSAKKLKQYIVIVAAFLFAIGVTYAEKDNITVFSTIAKEPAAIYKVNTNEKVIALTFDISWGNNRAEPILDILEEKNVKAATFFISAQWAEDHPKIAKRIAESGFEIGSHGYDHVYYSRLSDEEIKNQITKSHRIISDITGKKPRYIRPPNGDFDKRVLRIADSLGYKVIQWDTDSKDWENPGVNQIVQNVLSHAHPGDIVLLHASDSIKQTHLALPTIIDQLRKKGYKFVTVSELLSGTKTQTEEVK